ncbi:hypothetical protein ACNOYE_33415 [Nannocystaceae bacterium ST9]
MAFRTSLSLLILTTLLSAGCSISTTRYYSSAVPQQQVVYHVDRGNACGCGGGPMMSTPTSKPNRPQQHADPGGPRPQASPKPQPHPIPKPAPRPSQPPRTTSKPPRVPPKPAV